MCIVEVNQEKRGITHSSQAHHDVAPRPTFKVQSLEQHLQRKKVMWPVFVFGLVALYIKLFMCVSFGEYSKHSLLSCTVRVV